MATLKEITHEWSILCSYSIVDRDANNLSLINVIEQVAFDVQLQDGQSSDEGIVLPLNTVIVSRFRKLAEEDKIVRAQMQINFVDPKGKNLGTFEESIELNSGVKNIRMRSGVEGLRVTTSGLYKFDVAIKEENQEEFTKLYSLPLEVALNIK